MMSIAARLASVVRHPAVWIPAAVLTAATAVFRYTDLDLAIVQRFFSGDPSKEAPFLRFPLTTAQPWRTLYIWGVYPAWVLGCGGLLVWIAGHFRRTAPAPIATNKEMPSSMWTKLDQWRGPGLFFALLLVIGPGILVNWVFKPCWSRPRPHAVKCFGGPRDFVPVLKFGDGEEDSSFPSGHAATGFFLMAPALVCYRRRPWLALAFLLLGLSFGTLIGLARIVAGAHFPSDVLWSGGIVYFTALALAALFHSRASDERS
jgi:lipid A 4'-phosphatase